MCPQLLEPFKLLHFTIKIIDQLETMYTYNVTNGFLNHHLCLPEPAR